ncbi:MAG: cobyric acid synthase [Nitrospirae bacterium]|nr:cobyric acid synthase [Nitrospirota bacterium]
MTKALMIQGTGSGAGKSLVTAAFCRIFRDMGINVAPFKSQNMALNSFITIEGGEIGRAQALQAEAARVEPTVDMNPILLKVSGETGSQVIIHGKVHDTMRAQEYYAYRKEAWKAVKASYRRLSRKHDLIVIEGAGSPAEINLMDVDIVNMAVAKHAQAPVILIGDIDKGGVFASLYGTIKLLGRDSRYIKAFIINKFRGDIAILRPGLDMIGHKTGRPVIGVLPYVHDIGLPEEDGLALYKNPRFKTQAPPGKSKPGAIKIVVARLKYISNFTDFDPFICEPDVELLYSSNPADIENADIVIIPGSKNTVKDLMSLREQGLDESIKRAYAKGIQIIGVCGGYQMLGKKLFDPNCVESSCKDIDGIGLLNVETTFERTKTTCRVEAEMTQGKSGTEAPLKGYEIHMGETRGDTGLFRVKRTDDPHHVSSGTLDGSRNRNCWGTYIHGLFDNDLFRRDVLNNIREQKGLRSIDSSCSYSDLKEKALDNLARMVRENVDMDFVKREVKL